MAKLDVLQSLYNKKQSALDFNFDALTAPPLMSLLSPYDIMELNKIAKSVKLAGKIDLKYKLIDNIMTNRGFVKLHAGTNRVVYRFLEDQRFVAKIAVDRVGLGDNPAEFQNQFLLKPFVTKVFEVSPCGTIAIVERVDPIMSREEFLSVADDVFDLLTKVFIGKYILEDVGTQYFMNWSIRNQFGPVLLDFPYVYELDGNKLYCNAPAIPGRKDIVCGGEIDYDDGFNNLVCTKCGKHYQARELKKAEEQKLIIVGGKKTMKVRVKCGKDVIVDSSKNRTAKVIEAKKDVDVVKEVVKEEKPIQNKVESRVNKKTTSKKPKAKPNTPSDSIFKKEEPKEEKVEEKIEVVVTKQEENKTSVQSMNDELDAFLNNIEYDEYDDEDEYSEYDEYLSNRERKNIRNANKKTKKRNTDFSDF